MTDSDKNNGWDTYSKLVLQQLESLTGGIESLRAELQHVKEQLTELRAREDRVQEIKAWKDKIDEVASPSQMLVKFNEIEELKQFKVKAVTIFMIAQAITGFIIAYGQINIS
tara:strand:+ start:406 stop:741 length:336 start_codon:yes stop_codon:yes gene_type:complete